MIKSRRVLDYWPYIILFISVFIVAVALTKPGAILHQDFPFSIHALSPSKLLFTWIDFGSNNNFENLSRLPEIGVSIALLVMGLTPDLISKLMVVFVFYLASVSFYIFSTRLMRNKADLRYQLKIAAIIGSLFYAYNIWSFDRILHWHLWLGYAVLPLFFISIVLIFQNPRQWRYYLVAVVSWSVASSTPHFLMFFGLFFVGIASFFIITRIRNKRALIQSTTTTIMILTIFVLINAYWIYPAIQSLESGEINPTSIFGYVVTDETIKMYSEGKDITNAIRLTLGESAILPTTSPFYEVWLFAGFFLPALSFLALFSKRYFRYALVFALLAVLGIFLAMGSNAPFDLYSILLFKIPLVSNIVEKLLRDPERWAFLIALGYSFLLSITTFEVLKLVDKIRLRYQRIRFSNVIQGLFILMIVGSIGIISHQSYNYYLLDKYSPAILPPDFDELNQFIGSVDTDKVVYFPVLLYSDDVFHDVVWNDRNMLIADIYQWSSAKPNIGHYRDLYVQNYYRYLSSLLIDDKIENISNLITPFGTSYIIFHNDTQKPINAEFLEKLSSLTDVRNVTKIGFFNIFKTSNNNTSFNIPHTNLLVTGGLSELTALNAIPPFNSSLNSLLFLNQFIDPDKDLVTDTTPSGLILTNNAYDLVLSFIDNKYIVAPFDATNHHVPSELWSKASTLDPWRGEFHPYLAHYGMENWDWDYQKGLVITQAKGAKLDVPFNVETTSSYDIYVRYMENQKGGEVKVYLDNELLNDINTIDKSQNNFIWRNIASSINLTQGKHMLTLENVFGFNAVNVFSILPTNETIRLVENAHAIANNTRNIYLLEAESDFQSVGRSNFSHPYSMLDVGVTAEEKQVAAEGIIKIPSGEDYLSLYSLAGNNSTEKLDSSYRLDLDLIPSKDASTNIQLSTLGPGISSYHLIDNIDIQPSSLTIAYGENQSLSTPITEGANKTLAENNYPLRVDIKQGNSTDWNVIATDFIPVNDTIPYRYSLSMSAKDTNQIHSKVHYFNSNKEEIEDFIFGGIDSTFNNKTLVKTLRTPTDTAYVALSIWVMPNPGNDSYYLLNNAEIQLSPTGIWINENEENQSLSTPITEGANKTLAENNYPLRVDIKQGNSTDWNVIATDFIPVNEGGHYDLSSLFTGDDVNTLHWKIFFYNSKLQNIGELWPYTPINGTFHKNLEYGILPPLDTRYIIFSVWVKPNPIEDSHYVIDNFTLEEFIHQNKFDMGSYHLKNMNSTNQKVVLSEKSIGVDEIRGELEGFNIVRTEPIPVRENSKYNYTINVDLRNLTDFKIYAYTTGTDDVVINSTKYGNLVSNGKILTLTTDSEIFTELDILKSSNYTIAVHTNECRSCMPLILSITGDNGNNVIVANRNISLFENGNNIRNNDSSLVWLYLDNIYLERGHYQIKIYSGSQRDLDSIILYSSDSDKSDALDDIFNEYEAPAQIEEYTKIDPTEYTVNITNSTRPFVLSFSESYDPFWTMYATYGNGSKSETYSNSIPLFSIINGFYIDKLGNYTITIEYKPQQWFIEGGIISLASLLILLVGYPLFVFIRKNRSLA